jgi:TATA-box binding protein (TBP) (component of TFIID and TFIIIB)
MSELIVCDQTRLDKYRVSTITCNATLGVVIDLATFFQNVNITDGNGLIWAEFGKNTRGVYPKVRKELGNTRKCFDNQVTVIYKMNTYFPNIKVFRNGSIQMTGIRSKEDGMFACSVISDEIERLRNISGIKLIATDHIAATNNAADITNTEHGVGVAADAADGVVASSELREPVTAKDFKIRMINCDFGVPFKIRRKKLHLLLTSPTYNNVCSFQPVDYPGVKLQYYWNADAKCATDGVCKCESQCFGKGTGCGEGQCKKVTVSSFDSGKILITGANTFTQVNAAYHYIHKVIYDNMSDMKKTMPELPM